VELLKLELSEVDPSRLELVSDIEIGCDELLVKLELRLLDSEELGTEVGLDIDERVLDMDEEGIEVEVRL